jgi:8-oxo-dGTP diphosphatase
VEQSPSKKLYVRTSAKAIIIEDGRLLAIRKRDGADTFYTLPGGTQEHGETLAEAAAREVLEETGARVQVGPLRHVRDYVGAHHEFAERQGHLHRVEFWFECRLLAPPGTQPTTHPDKRQIGIEWIELDRVEDYPLYPRVLAELLAGADRDAPVYLGDVN